MKEFRTLEAELKARQDAEAKAEKTEKSASFEPESKVAKEPVETETPSVAEQHRRTIQIPETIQFPAKRSLDDTSMGLDVAGNLRC